MRYAIRTTVRRSSRVRTSAVRRVLGDFRRHPNYGRDALKLQKPIDLK